MSHVKLNSRITQTSAQAKVTDAKIEKFSDEVTAILRREAASKMKKLMYVFVTVNQQGPTSFTYEIDDSRDKISDESRNLINTRFEEFFQRPGSH